DGHLNPIDGDHLLQVKTVEVGKRHIQNQTVRDNRARASEESLSRRKCFRQPAFEADQRFQRFAHRDVVINNEDDRYNLRCGCWFRFLIRARWAHIFPGSTALPIIQLAPSAEVSASSKAISLNGLSRTSTAPCANARARTASYF